MDVFPIIVRERMEDEAMERWSEAKKKLDWYRARGRDLEKKRVATWEQKSAARLEESSKFLENRRTREAELRNLKVIGKHAWL